MTKEELEKEAEEYFKSIGEDYNEEYERTGKRHYFVGFDIKNGYLAGAEPRENQIAELKKENAELRKDKKELCHSISEGGKACVYLNGQLTKAKKIIQEFLELNYSEFIKTNAVFLHADKFLKES